MNKASFIATVINILSNTFLFIIKLWAGIVSGSIAVISDALNSFTDIVSSVAIFICVRISEQDADDGHPFGHSRAEPIAGLIVAVMAGILGFEIIRTSIERFLNPQEVKISSLTFAVLFITIVMKTVLGFYFRFVSRNINSPAIKATSVDCFMDAVVSAVAVAGIVGVMMGYPLLDPIMGLLISFWIIYTGYSIGMENIDYLMGSSPDDDMMAEIVAKSLSVDNVQSIGMVRAHYVGNYIHVEVHVDVDKNLSTLESHDISVNVAREVESIKSIEKTFVHVDPV